jgi:hypothetical protein
MSRRSLYLIGLISLLLAASLLTLRYGQTFSPNTLYLTQIVNTFTGVVEKKEGNVLTVSQTVLTYDNKPHKLTYSVLVTKNTSFLRPPVTVTYLFAPPLSVPDKKYEIEDLVIGSTITISTLSDLRLLKGNTFEAVNIYLSAAVNYFTGEILAIKKDTLTFKTTTNKTLEVGITAQTEISRNAVTAPTTNGIANPFIATRMSINDLKKGMQASVFTAEDVLTNKSLTALRIEPVIQPISSEIAPTLKPLPTQAPAPSQMPMSVKVN